MFASAQIIKPAGIDTITARNSTNSILSLKVDFITFLKSGTLYFGSSKISEPLLPFSAVLLSIFEHIIVTITERTMKDKSIRLAVIEFLAKNIDITAIKNGNRPLQGVKELVIMAMFLSLFESIIRAPVTPIALQPSPIQVVRACLPQALHFSKGESRLNANLGSMPKSSRSEKREEYNNRRKHYRNNP